MGPALCQSLTNSIAVLAVIGGGGWLWRLLWVHLTQPTILLLVHCVTQVGASVVLDCCFCCAFIEPNISFVGPLCDTGVGPAQYLVGPRPVSPARRQQILMGLEQRQQQAELEAQKVCVTVCVCVRVHMRACACGHNGSKRFVGIVPPFANMALGNQLLVKQEVCGGAE
eukprot:1160344-Pelagomonas_calceolata.AAC.2